jgi:hypothetical protein
MGRLLTERREPASDGRKRMPGVTARVLRGATALASVGLLLSLGTGLAVATQPASAASSSQTIYAGNATANATATATASRITAHAIPATGNVAPLATLTTGRPSVPLALALDAKGNLWCGNTSSTITAYTPAQLAAGGKTAPAIILTAIAVDGLAFTGTGSLWAAHWSSSVATSSLTKYTPTQLTKSGKPTPAVTITSDTPTSATASLHGPENIAFNATGDLWVANSENDTLVEFAPTQLTKSGSPTPKVTIKSHLAKPTTPASGVLRYPTGVAFGPAGNLWVTSRTVATAVEYTPAQLAASGSPAPATTLTLPGTSWADAFDGSGNLWIGMPSATGALVGYSPAQQAAGGTVKPAYDISGATTKLDYSEGVTVKAPPTVTMVTPPSGPASGGSTVTVDGTGFTSSTAVAFGSTPGTTVSVVSPFKLTVKAPPGGGTVNVTTTTFAGTSATSSADQYTYASTGYRLVASDGGIFSFGTAPFHGSMGGKPLNAPVVGMASDLATGGYWMVASDGGIFAFTAPFYGSMGGKPLNAPIVAMAALPTGKGYWMVAADGGVFSFGTATFHGSMGGKPLNKPIVGMAAQPTGGGYWMVASDGGIFSFGTATFHGSMGGKPLNAPIVAMAPAPTGSGYWMVAADGGIFAFTVPFLGSMGGKPLNKPIVGMTAPATGKGYWMVASDGGIFAFTVPFFGSMGGKPLNKPIVGMSAA